MRNILRTALILAMAALLLIGEGSSPAFAQKPPRRLNVLVLLGEWFGQAYFRLEEEIKVRAWTMKRVGVDAEYRGCDYETLDLMLRSDILIHNTMNLSGFDCLIIPTGPQFRKFFKNQTVLKFVRDAKLNEKRSK